MSPRSAYRNWILRPLTKLRRWGPVAAVADRVFLSRAEIEALSVPMLWAVLSAVCLRFAYPTFDWSWLAWVGLAPFLRQFHGRDPKQCAWLGLGFGTVFFYLNLTWLNTLRDFNPFVPVGIFLLALLCALSTTLFGALSALVLGRRGWLRFFLIPSLWVAIEYARSLSELAFPWIYLGHSQASWLEAIQICDLTGVYGVSFLIVLVNLTISDSYRFAFRGVGGAGRLWPKWLVAAALVAATLGYGTLRLRETQSAEQAGLRSQAFRVALVQPAVPQWKVYMSYASENLEKQARLQTEMTDGLARQVAQIRDVPTSASQPNLYVFPESAVTTPFFNLYPSRLAFMRELARRARAPILFGANRFEGAPGAKAGDPRFFQEGNFYNSAYLARPDSEVDVAGAYDKMHLVPFGEFSSYLGAIPGFSKFVLGIEDFARGTQPRLFEVDGTKFGCLICFESCFAYLTRRYDALDADWIAILTNDAWYKTSSGAKRHQTQAIFRAIEMRRPIVRVANTGISCVIDPSGRTRGELAVNENRPTQHSVAIALRPQSQRDAHTLYMRYGEWFAWLCVALSALILVANIRFSGRRREEPLSDLRLPGGGA